MDSVAHGTGAATPCWRWAASRRRVSIAERSAPLALNRLKDV